MYDTTYTDTASAAAATGIMAALGIWMFVILALAVVMLVAMWKLFTKAGKPGWAAIVPIYNVYILLEIVGRPVWWLVFVFAGIIPVIGYLLAFAFSVILAIDTARAFGKETGFGIFLVFLPFIGYPMLAFGNAKYVGANPIDLPIPNSTTVGAKKAAPAKPAEPAAEEAPTETK